MATVNGSLEAARTEAENMYPNLSAQGEKINGPGNQYSGILIPWKRRIPGSSALRAREYPRAAAAPAEE